jgi:hypothetical protein
VEQRCKTRKGRRGVELRRAERKEMERSGSEEKGRRGWKLIGVKRRGLERKGRTGRNLTGK